MWRQIFEDGDHGRIDDMLVAKNCEYSSLSVLLLISLYTSDLAHMILSRSFMVFELDLTN